MSNARYTAVVHILTSANRHAVTPCCELCTVNQLLQCRAIANCLPSPFCCMSAHLIACKLDARLAPERRCDVAGCACTIPDASLNIHFLQQRIESTLSGGTGRERR